MGGVAPERPRTSALRACARRVAGAIALAVLFAPPVMAGPHEAVVISAEARAHALMQRDPPAWQEARVAFEQAAAQGSVRAMAYLGWLHENGHGVDVDKESALTWYGRAADAGAHEYAVKSGWMLLGRSGVESDRAAAEERFKQAIAGGHLPANIAFASVLIADAQGGRSGDRVFEARSLLEEALAGGEHLASFFLARLYIEGIGTHPVDDALALRYTRIGAEHGHAQMQGWLAVMYAEGSGVAADVEEAAFWAALAAAGGDPVGQRLHVALDAELSPAQKESVIERALHWSPDARTRG